MTLFPNRALSRGQKLVAYLAGFLIVPLLALAARIGLDPAGPAKGYAVVLLVAALVLIALALPGFYRFERR